jgi:hypothetical protein
MSGHPADVDPVLIKLRSWANDRALSREAIAARLGVSRTAVAGWFAGLAAIEAGTRPPPGARSFRFLAQRPEVQQNIAEVLGQPFEVLRGNALVTRGGGPRSDAEPGSPATGEVAPELADIATEVLGDLLLGSPDRAVTTLRHRIAEVVESVPEVVATVTVKEPRGSDRSQAYQHQIGVFLAGYHGDRRAYLRANRDRITTALAEAGLPGYWEHGGKVPRAELAVAGQQHLFAGSLVCPYVAATRAARVGLLAPPGRGPERPGSLRVAAIVTSPYGGSGPIAGHIALCTGVGHARGEDLRQWVRDAQSRRGFTRPVPRGALGDDAADLDAGFITHQGLHSLQRGLLPGAWLLSTEVGPLVRYEPLRSALVHLDGVLVTVSLGEQWRRLAAWRLAAAELNSAGQDGQGAGRRSSDQISCTGPGRRLDRWEREILERQRSAAQTWMSRLAGWDEVLRRMAEQREREHPGSGTLRIVLDPLPPLRDAYRFAGDRLTRVTGDERFAGDTVFPDDVDAMMESWVAAAAEVVTGFARLAGQDGERFAEYLASLLPGPVTEVLRARPRVGAAWTG